MPPDVPPRAAWRSGRGDWLRFRPPRGLRTGGDECEAGRGARRPAAAWREARGAAPLLALKNCLTMRSSRLWNDTTASRPCGLSMAIAASKAALQFAQLVIHMDAQRLEGAGGGMDGMAQRGGALRLGHDLGQLRGAGDGAGGDDGAGDAAGVLFLAQPRDHRGQGAVIGAVDEIGGGFARKAHAHVQRAVFAEGKTARRLCRTGRRKRPDPARCRRWRPANASMRENSPSTSVRRPAKCSHQRLAAGDGFGIAVDAQHAAIGGFQNGAGIAAAAESAVNIVRAVLGLSAAITSASITGRWPLMRRAHEFSSRARSQPGFHARHGFGFDRAHKCPNPRSGISATCRQRRRGPSAWHARSWHRAGARGPARRPPATGCAR